MKCFFTCLGLVVLDCFHRQHKKLWWRISIKIRPHRMPTNSITIKLVILQLSCIDTDETDELKLMKNYFICAFLIHYKTMPNCNAPNPKKRAFGNIVGKAEKLV